MRIYSYIPLIVLTLVSLVTVAILYALSEAPFRYQQNFTRVLADPILPQSRRDLNNKNIYLAGATNKHVYLGDKKASLMLFITDYSLNEIDTIRLCVSDPTDLALGNSRIEIDSPYFYIKKGSARAVFRGMIVDWYAAPILDSITYFSQAVPLRDGGFAYVAEGGSEADVMKTNLLCKVTLNNSVTIRPNILTGFTDRYYSTKGTLRYSATLNKLVYVYTYRDEYILLDTGLTLQQTAHSIGTMTREHIRPVEINHGIYTLASTSVVVNRGARVQGNLLFIHSNLRGRTESKAQFDSSNMIDIYDLRTQTYLFSISVPNVEHIKLTTFRVMNSNLITQHGEFIATYAIRDEAFKNLLISDPLSAKAEQE